MDDRGVDVGVGLEVELAQRLLPGEGGGLEAAFGAAPVAVVALGHQQLGQEPAVGHLVADGSLGQFGELGTDGGQPQDQVNTLLT